MTDGSVVAGALLVLPVALVATESLGYRHSPYGHSWFWALPLDDKLDHIGRHTRAWWRINLPWFPTLAVTTAGLAGLAFLLADPWAWAALGGYLLAAGAWAIAVAQQTAGMAVAAEQRAESGETPAWAHATWQVGYVLEGVWVLLANLAAAAYGVAVLRTDLLPSWLGWAAIAVGLAIPAGVLLTRNGFPHLALPVPLALGVALLIVGI
ncbi:MAG TPA: hypothetical protein VK925_08030 [Jiangellaceae bacterium]|nr:hypothetical protein [Jiangellaceae bacterium]